MTTGTMNTEPMTSAAALTTDSIARPTTFMHTLTSEWVKLITLRSTFITMGAGVVLSVVMTAVVTLAVGSTWDGWSAERQAQFAPVLMTMSGNVILLIAASVFGALAVASEYSSGMIRLTLTATPRRGQVLLAKLLLVSGITLVLGVITTVAMFLVGQAVLESYGIPMGGLGDSGVQRLVLGLGVATPLFPVFGVALGVILRSTAGAITAVMGMLWLPQVFGELLPAGPQKLFRFAPQSGADSLTVAHFAESPLYSDPALGVAIVVVWLVAFVGAAYFLLKRRDA